MSRLKKALAQQQKCTVQLLNYRKDGERCKQCGRNSMCVTCTEGATSVDFS